VMSRPAMMPSHASSLFPALSHPPTLPVCLSLVLSVFLSRSFPFVSAPFCNLSLETWTACRGPCNCSVCQSGKRPVETALQHCPAAECTIWLHTEAQYNTQHVIDYQESRFWLRSPLFLFVHAWALEFAP
jgi:hypothetical protein